MILIKLVEVIVMLQLTQKERMLLEDEKHHEDICIKKYKNYAQQAQDTQLKNLFNSHAQVEQHHFDTINQMLQGQEPNMNQGQQGQQQQGQQQQSGTTQATGQQTSYQGAMRNVGDEVLCSDLLSTEKYISGTYDTAIFEAVNPTVRQTLQHIQQEEQKHGEDIFNYMNSHGMYNVK